MLNMLSLLKGNSIIKTIALHNYADFYQIIVQDTEIVIYAIDIHMPCKIGSASYDIIYIKIESFSAQISTFYYYYTIHL